MVVLYKAPKAKPCKLASGEVFEMNSTKNMNDISLSRGF